MRLSANNVPVLSNVCLSCLRYYSNVYLSCLRKGECLRQKKGAARGGPFMLPPERVVLTEKLTPAGRNNDPSHRTGTGRYCYPS